MNQRIVDRRIVARHHQVASEGPQGLDSGFVHRKSAGQVKLIHLQLDLWWDTLEIYMGHLGCGDTGDIMRIQWGYNGESIMGEASQKQWHIRLESIAPDVNDPEVK